MRIIIHRFILVLTFTVLSVTTSFARPKIGLVLGGGGAKGAAHIGVLRVLEEVGLHVDYIAGTSIGSIVGGLYSVGYRSNDIAAMFSEQKWLKLFAGEMVEGGRIEVLLDSMLTAKLPIARDNDSLSFDALPIPFRCVAVELLRMDEVVLSKGNLSRSIRASMAVPIALRSVEIDGKRLVDGGMLNNLPVDVVRQMGADIVIAIDLQQNKHRSKDFSLKEQFGIGGILDWIVSRPDWRRYNDNCADADIYINPNLDGYDATSFSQIEIKDMIEKGEKAAREQIKRLRHPKKKRR